MGSEESSLAEVHFIENRFTKYGRNIKDLKERDYLGKKFIYGVSTCNRGCALSSARWMGRGKKDEAGAQHQLCVMYLIQFR